jgi:hypothetical protein
MLFLTQERYAPLLAQVQAMPEVTAAAIDRLRRSFSASEVASAVELIRARRKAAAKFPFGDRMLADLPGIEQATAFEVAMHKARRIASAGFTHVLDLCCGIGGDATAFAHLMDVTLIDHDEQRLAMARYNVHLATGKHCPAAAADVTKLQLPGTHAAPVIHLDPARRSAAGRTHRYAEYLPSPVHIRRLIDSAPATCIKLGPGVELDLLPPGHLEMISHRGSLVQAILWTGQLASALNPGSFRSATVIDPAGSSATLSGSPRSIPLSSPKRFLLAVDPAVERAELLGNLAHQLRAPAIHPALGLLTTDEPTDSPFTTRFELMESMGFHPRRVKQWLEEHDGGIVEIKTRDKVADPDTLVPELRGPGNVTFTVFVVRFDQRVQALITRRCSEPV